MEDAMNSSSVERLYELRDRSDTIVHEEHPLVSNVASVLSEFNETDLLYVLIDVPVTTDAGTTRKTTIFTYDGVDASRVPSGFAINTSSAPTSQAYKEVIRYSDKRCQVDLDTPEGMLAIKIIVCN